MIFDFAAFGALSRRVIPSMKARRIVASTIGRSIIVVLLATNTAFAAPPVITIIGDNPVSVSVNSVYNDAGATAFDLEDGNITASIVTDNPVNTSIVGQYFVEYTVTDSELLTDTKSRVVNVIDDVAPVITLQGSNPLNLDQGDVFAEPGFTALDNVDGNITGNVVIGGDTVNTAVPGTYLITYNVSDTAGNAAVQVTRTVNVADTEAPVITLLGANPVNLNQGDTYSEPGFTATDNVDGNITANVAVGGDAVNTAVPGTYVITYNVSDTAGNAAIQVTRTVNVADTEAPVITLLGANPLNLNVGDVFIDPGATATDNVDGNVTANIVVGGDAVNTAVPGTYVITYNVTDTAGNAATQVTRTVNVTDGEPPVITLLGDNPLNLNAGDVFTDPGFTATDDIDGDVTADVVVGGDAVNTAVPGTYLVTYNVSDSAGNAAIEVVRTVNVSDGDPPTITLLGDNPLALNEDDVFTDPGVTATDNVDGDLTASVVVGGDTVNTAVPGTYVITYNVSDAAGNAAPEVTRTVTVNSRPTATNVAITGTPVVGQTLTGNYTYNDAEGDLEGVSVYQWLRNGVRISGATAQTYLVAPADKEKSLQFEVRPAAATGASPGDPVLSAEVLVSNTAPSITGQNVVQVVEDGSREIVLADLVVSDQDSVFPDDFTLTVRDGPNYTRGGTNGNTIFPVLDFNGTLTVPVTVNDGFVDSGVFNLVVTVTPVNDAPVINGLSEPLSTPEDQSITIAFGDLDVSDVDTDDVYPTGFGLQLQPGANYTVSGTIVTPAENFNGQITVPVTVTDPGGLASQVFPIPITVTAENDTPALDAPIEDQIAIENSPFSLNVSGNFSDADNDTLTYSATGLPASNNITINAVTGVISGTPRIEDARDNAPYVVAVTASDPSGATTIGTFDLTISALDRANLALRIDVSPDTGLPSDELRWTFTALNTLGPQAGNNVQLTGRFIGTGLTVIAEPGANCTIEEPIDVVIDFFCVIGTLPVGASTPTVMTTTTSQATEVVAFATVAGVDNLPIDPNEEDNSDIEAAGVAEAFSAGAVQFLGSTSIRSVAAGDVNVAGEGAIDIVVGTAAGQPVQIYLGDAPRESCDCLRDFLPSPISIPDNGANEGVALADFNRDGSLDLVVVNGGGQPDRVFVNDGDGNFSPIATLETSFGAAVAVADFNLDGNPDIAVAEIGARNRVYFGDGFGGFPGGSIRLGTAGVDEANSNDVAAADFNGDGRPDLVFANVGGASRTWLAQADGGFARGAPLPVADAVAVAAGDLNGDGRADLVFGRVSSSFGDVPFNPVLLNDGSGGFGAPAQILGISPTNDVLIGDVNSDGSPDIVFINASGVHQVWAASGSGYTLQREQIIDIDAREGVLAHLGFTDTDNPGGLDLAMGGSTGSGVGVYLNDAAGNLGRGDVEPPVITLNGNAAVSIESGLAYSDAGATAADNIDGDISADIRVTNTVNTAVVGSYTVSYDVRDFAGNAAVTVTRTVNVTPAAGSGGGGGGALSYWLAFALLGVLASTMVERPKVRAKRVRAATRK